MGTNLWVQEDDFSRIWSGEANASCPNIRIVCRVRGEIIRSVLCDIVRSNCAQCYAHTHINRPNSSPDWVLSHWAHFTLLKFIFSERELTLYAIARPSVVCLSSVTFVRPTQAVETFGNISMALVTLAIH